jgi:uncharacterized protein YdcH (DUF465 family)
VGKRGTLPLALNQGRKALFYLDYVIEEHIMKRLDHLQMQHKLLDEQIDELERKHKLPDVSEEKMIADLKKERLKLKDQIVHAKIADMQGASSN